MVCPRVIFDTCIPVAALRLTKKPAVFRPHRRMIAWWAGGQVRGIVSGHLLAEYDEVLRRHEPSVAPERRRLFLNQARDAALSECFALQEPFEKHSKDPDDDHLCALALASSADYLATDNVEDLLDLHFIGDTMTIDAILLQARLELDLLIEAAVVAGN